MEEFQNIWCDNNLHITPFTVLSAQSQPSNISKDALVAFIFFEAMFSVVYMHMN